MNKETVFFTTMKKIYFATNNNKLVTNYELAKMALVVDNVVLDATDFENIRKYARGCKGIKREVKPSIKVCLQNGEDVKAVMIYRDRHPGMSLMEARAAIYEMKAKMAVK